MDNIDGYNCVCQPDGMQTETVVLSHFSGVDTTSNVALNTLSTKKLIELNITSSRATVFTNSAPITSVHLPSIFAGKFN